MTMTVTECRPSKIIKISQFGANLDFTFVEHTRIKTDGPISRVTRPDGTAYYEVWGYRFIKSTGEYDTKRRPYIFDYYSAYKD